MTYIPHHILFFFFFFVVFFFRSVAIYTLGYISRTLINHPLSTSPTVVCRKEAQVLVHFITCILVKSYFLFFTFVFASFFSLTKDVYGTIGQNLPCETEIMCVASIFSRRCGLIFTVLWNPIRAELDGQSELFLPTEMCLK